MFCCIFFFFFFFVDQPAILACDQCQDDFCEVCFYSQHRKGTRKRHTVKKLAVSHITESSTSTSSSSSLPVHAKSFIGTFLASTSQKNRTASAAATTSAKANSADAGLGSEKQALADEADEESSLDQSRVDDVANVDWSLMGTEAMAGLGTEVKTGEWFINRSKYIPLRLNLTERKYLRLLEVRYIYIHIYLLY